MHFCPFCSSLLVPEHQQTINLICTACPYIYKLNTTLSSSKNNTVKMIEEAVEEDLKYANKCQIKCPKCSFDEAMFVEFQTRSADEPMTIFYQCVSCKHNWKE